jgi:diguanylate cyclase (GGDEF)-like protein
LKHVHATAWVAGAIAAGLGLFTVLGFSLHEASWVRLEIGKGTAIALNTAIGLLLGGVALLFPARPPYQRVASGLGAALVLLSAGVLLEHLLGRDLGLDAVRLHLWLGPSATPGRMVPTTCAALLCCGVVLLLAPHSAAGFRAAAVRVLTLVTFGIGASGLLGYVLQFDSLYTWTAATRMAPQTAVGLTALGLGLWQRWRRPWHAPARPAEASGRIVSTATVSLLAVATITGLGNLYLLQHLAQESAVDALLRRRDDYSSQIRSAIQQRLELSRAMAAQLEHAGAAEAGRLAADLPAHGYSGVMLLDARGAAVATGGSFHASETTITLALPGAPQLLWHHGYWLRLDLPLTSPAMAHVRLEAPLPLLDQLALQNGDEMGICGPRAESVVCFPAGPSQRPFTLTARRSGRPWTAADALAAAPGWIQSTDQRGERVLAAFGSVGDTGLAVIQKRNLDALYAPVRKRFEIILPLLAALILLGVGAMRWQVRPLESRLTALARSDALTGLPNRATFVDRLEQAVAAAQRDPARGSLALLYLDVDHFKQANDTLGHAAGDRLLREFAGRVAGCVRASDTTARFGGDEFTVLLEGLRHPGDAERTAGAIRASLAAPFDLAGTSRAVTASIGIAYYQPGGGACNADMLLHHADEALYEVKRRGRDGVLLVQPFSPAP